MFYPLCPLWLIREQCPFAQSTQIFQVRLTAEGRLLLCLGQEHSVDLRRVLRAHPDDDRRLKQAIVKAMDIKPRGHDFESYEKPILLRHMNMTGG